MNDPLRDIETFKIFVPNSEIRKIKIDIAGIMRRFLWSFHFEGFLWFLISR